MRYVDVIVSKRKIFSSIMMDLLGLFISICTMIFPAHMPHLSVAFINLSLFH